jgi:hypothetical protein
MFLALRRKTVNFPASLTSNVQFELNRTNYSYAQIVKTSSLQDVTKQNNTQTQNAAQEQQTNDILELKNMIKDILMKINSMLNILTVFVTKIL